MDFIKNNLSQRATETKKEKTYYFLFFRSFSIVFFVFFILFFSGCQVPEEGCTDVAASNFDITALKTCATNCCVYPQLKIRTQFLWGSDAVFFDLNTPYKIGLDSVKFLSAQLYISAISFTPLAGGKNVSVSDSIALYRANDTIMRPNNYALIGKNYGFNYTLGSFTGFGSYNYAHFTVGLDSVSNMVIPSKMPASSPFAVKADSAYDNKNSTFIFQKFIFVKGANYKDTVQINIENAQTIDAGCRLTFIRGFDAVMPFKIDYKKLFLDVNVQSDPNTIAQKIVSNYTNSFSVQ